MFAFLLAITEVNMYLYLRWKIWRNTNEEELQTLHQFRKRLAYALIENEYIIDNQTEAIVTRSRSQKKHIKKRCPPFAKCYTDGRWVCTAKAMYQQ